jgi:hypothetical protein
VIPVSRTDRKRFYTASADLCLSRLTEIDPKQPLAIGRLSVTVGRLKAIV